MPARPSVDPTAASGSPDAPAIGGAYARYTLAVLVVVYVFNFLDRQIISILAEDIRADLGLSDAQLGFLYGTAFAVFYAIFGIPLGRLADLWSRRSLIALGLAVWSGMTALSGLARGFGQLASARVGVGVGEASATPAAFSMLSDWFPPARRATVLAIYSSGIYLGAGLGLGIGGLVVDAWNGAYPEGAPFGLRGWQVAYLVVGLPGLVVALWVRSLREPVRGQADGVVAPPAERPLREFGRELAAVLPPLTVWSLWREGAGTRGLTWNLVAAAAVALAAAGLTAVTGDTAQWWSLGAGLYAAISWAQSLHLRDREGADLIFRTPSLRWAALGFAFLAFTGYGIGFWTPPFLMRVHGVDPGQAGPILGATSAASGWLGVILGGVIADRWRLARVDGRLRLGMAAALLPLPVGYAFLSTDSVVLAYLLNFPLGLFAAGWIGGGAATVQDLVPPRLRATASAAYLLVITFIGLALGPYGIGRASVAFGDLRLAMLMGFAANGIAVACLWRAGRSLADDEARVRDRPPSVDPLE